MLLGISSRVLGYDGWMDNKTAFWASQAESVKEQSKTTGMTCKMNMIQSLIWRILRSLGSRGLYLRRELKSYLSRYRSQVRVFTIESLSKVSKT
jgi:hypothetical protein